MAGGISIDAVLSPAASRAIARSRKSIDRGFTIPTPADWCSSARSGPSPAWHRRADARRKASGCGAKVPFGRWNAMTFLAALRHDRITAPRMFDGPINAERFLVDVEQVRVPTLCRGDVGVMDNLGSHTGAAVRAAIRAAGAHLFFLPPDSPDLNPVEQVFAKLKHLLRKAAERSVDATSKRIGMLLGMFSAKECANYLVNSGYASV